MTQLRGANMGLNKSVDDINALVEQGANHLRWQLVNMSPEVDTWTHDQYIQWLDAELDALGTDTLIPYKCVALMTPPGGDRFWSQAGFQRQLPQIWAHIARRTKNFYGIWGYDLLNEPRIPTGTWRDIAKSVLTAIRGTGSTKEIIVSSRNGNPQTLAEMKPINGIRTYTVHIYRPMAYTHQGVYPAYPHPVNYVQGESTKDLNKCITWMHANPGNKIYVGEFSAARWSPDCAKWLREITAQLNVYSLSWAYHAWRDAHTWDLEFPATFCPDGSCVGVREVTDRLQIMQQAWMGQ